MVMRLEEVTALNVEIKALKEMKASDPPLSLGRLESRDPAQANSAVWVSDVTKILQTHLPSNAAQVTVALLAFQAPH